MQKIIDDFHKLYHGTLKGTWHRTFWMGVKTIKCPLDLWMYQELIHKIKPDWIVETGTAFGGSAMFLASMCDLIEHGNIVSIDIKPPPPVEHPRITFMTGSSTDSHISKSVQKMVSGTCIVILDSNHKKNHVLRELEIYNHLVKPGSYIIVEDTNLNGVVRQDHGPGPREAVREFLVKNKRFQVDKDCEKFYMTFNPGGYLKCVR